MSVRRQWQRQFLWFLAQSTLAADMGGQRTRDISTRKHK
jgi:hypothetical protein